MVGAVRAPGGSGGGWRWTGKGWRTGGPGWSVATGREHSGRVRGRPGADRVWVRYTSDTLLGFQASKSVPGRPREAPGARASVCTQGSYCAANQLPDADGAERTGRMRAGWLRGDKRPSPVYLRHISGVPAGTPGMITGSPGMSHFGTVRSLLTAVTRPLLLKSLCICPICCCQHRRAAPPPSSGIRTSRFQWHGHPPKPRLNRVAAHVIHPHKLEGRRRQWALSGFS